MRPYLILAVVALGGFFSLFSVRFAAGLFLWNDIFRPLFWARNPEAFPIVNMVFAILLGSYFLNAARRKFKPRLNAYILFIPIYMAWIFITVLKSPYRDAAVQGFEEILKLLFPLMLISSCIKTRADVRFLVLVLTLSVGLWSAQSGIYVLIKGPSTDLGIPGGQMTDNNDFMAATVSILPTLLYLALGYQGAMRRTVKAMGLLMVFLSLAAISMSSSRGAALGVAGCLVLFIALVSQRKLMHTLLIVGALGIAFPLLPQSFWDRMHTINLGVEQTEGSAAERVHMMKSAAMAVADYPVFGVGPQCWLLVAPTYSGMSFDPHNIWLKLGAEVGIPGVLLFLVIPWITIRGLLSVRKAAIRNGDAESANLAVALIMAIFGFLLPSTFLSHPFSEFLWSWYAIGNGFIVIYKDGMRPARPRRLRASKWLPRASSESAATDQGPEAAGAAPLPEAHA